MSLDVSSESVIPIVDFVSFLPISQNPANLHGPKYLHFLYNPQPSLQYCFLFPFPNPPSRTGDTHPAQTLPRPALNPALGRFFSLHLQTAAYL